MQSSGPPVTTSVSSAAGATATQSVGGTASKPGGNVIRPPQPTSYHVPRGAAAVANIAVPRPTSLATVRSGPSGSLVSIRGSGRAPNPAPPQPQQQIRTRPASSPAHAASRPITPQRSDTPRPSLNPSVDKSFVKSPVPLHHAGSRVTPLGQGRLGAFPALSSQGVQPVQIVTQTVNQAVTLAASQPSSQATIQPTMQVITQGAQGTPSSISHSGIQPTLSTVTLAPGNKPRPITQAAQAGTVTTLSTNPPAVVLATPARLTSPAVIGMQTGPTRLAVATALPASGARIVSPSARVPQGRTVTYTSSHQVTMQAGRVPAANVRVNTGRGVVSLHPVLGVAPLKPVPTLSQGSTSTTTISAQPVGQSTAQVSTPTPTIATVQSSQPTSLPSLQPASLRALSTPSKVMASAVVTVAAVGGGPLRSVVAAVPPGVTAASTLAPAPSVSSAPVPAPVSKPGTTYPQTLTTVAARPVAVAGQQVRPVQGQPSVYIQTAHRSSPGPAGERSGTFPIQPTAYFYEAPSGSYQVANVAGRTYTGGPPYIVQATAARPVGTAPHGSAATGQVVPSSVPVAASVVTSVVSAAAAAAAAASGPAPVSAPASAPGGATGVVTSIAGGVVSTAGQPGPPRFNSIMVLDPSRTALPIHAMVPAEGGASGPTYIAADGSLLPVQGLPLPLPAANQAGTAVAAQGLAVPVSAVSVSSQEAPQPPAPQIVTQVASVVSQPVTSSSAGHLPMQIQVVPAPVHIQMHQQGQAPISQPQIIHSTSQAVASHLSVHTSHPTSLASHQTSHTQTPTSLPLPMTLGMPHTVSMTHAVSHSQPHAPVYMQGGTQGHLTHTSLHPTSQAHGPQVQTPTTPNKPNASPRPSILRKRDNEGSPMKAQKNLTPLLQSMSSSMPSSSSASCHSVAVNPPSPLSPPKRPDSGGPQSSGSTTISATSSPGQESPPTGSNQPPPSAASITAGLHAAGLHGTEMSPRKKPRKQQLTGNELQEHKMSDEEMEFMAEDNGDDFPLNQQPQQQQQLHQQVLLQQQQQQQQQQHQAALPPPPPVPREFTLKRPNISLLSTYRYSWKSRNNHFLRHSDVKPKDERRPSVSELASQRHIYQRLNGWKVHHLTAQMEDLADVESQVCQQLEAMLGMMERKAEQDEDKDVIRVNELIKGNMQRSRVVADQLVEARTAVMKIFDHKPHVSDIIHRSSGKRERIFRKREKS